MDIITMTNNKQYMAFKIYDNGSAAVNLNGATKLIEDFATCFIRMCEAGWRKVTEITIPTSDRAYNQISCCKSESRKGILPQLSGFRSEWNEMWEELVDNYDRG